MFKWKPKTVVLKEVRRAEELAVVAGDGGRWRRPVSQLRLVLDARPD